MFFAMIFFAEFFSPNPIVLFLAFFLKGSTFFNSGRCRVGDFSVVWCRHGAILTFFCRDGDHESRYVVRR